jgi:dihydroflavonol-4-reductase
VVAVTGASGYIGSHICHALLQKGFKVRAVVRNKDDENKVAHLKAMAVGLPEGALTFYNGDLSKAGSYDDAFEGASGVVHSAAVVEIYDIKDAQKQIVDPSIEGTKNVLSSLDKSSTIKRLVHTSSIAAIQSVDQADGTEFTETDWNTWSTIDNGDAYGYAKTQAERLVHDHVKQRPYGYAVVNPAVALGPCLTKAHTKASVVIIRQLLYGNEQGNWFGTYVDVRDVALAHVEALVRPEAQGQRFIAANPKASRWVVELEEPTQRLFPDYKVEGCAKPWYLIGIARFLTWFGMGLTPFQENMLDKKFTFNSATTTKVLGVEFRDIEESIKDSVESMVKPGWIKPRPNK